MRGPGGAQRRQALALPVRRVRGASFRWLGLGRGPFSFWLLDSDSWILFRAQPVVDQVQAGADEERRREVVDARGDLVEGATDKALEEGRPEDHERQDQAHPEGVADELQRGGENSATRERRADDDEEDRQSASERRDGVGDAEEKHRATLVGESDVSHGLARRQNSQRPATQGEIGPEQAQTNAHYRASYRERAAERLPPGADDQADDREDCYEAHGGQHPKFERALGASPAILGPAVLTEIEGNHTRQKQHPARVDRGDHSRGEGVAERKQRRDRRHATFDIVNELSAGDQSDPESDPESQIPDTGNEFGWVLGRR